MTRTTHNESRSPETLPDDLFASGLRATIIGMIVNALLIVLKLFGGIAGHSSALIADAVHSCSDFLTDIGVIIGLRFVSKPADSTHAYGHGRIETAITLLMGIAIIVTGIGLFRGGAVNLYTAFKGMYPARPGVSALIVGILSILSKEGLFQYTRIVARKSGSRSLEANAWHHRSDALSSIGTVIGVGGAMALGSSWTILDPLAAMFVSILVVKAGVGIGWNSFRELTDESLSKTARKNIRKKIIRVEGVLGCHKLRTRRLGRYATIDVHIQVNATLTVREGHDIATEVENALRSGNDTIAFVTVHVEPAHE